MNRYMKLLISVGLLFLLIGTVSAFDRDSLKPIPDCGPFADGCSNYTYYGDRYFFVEQIDLDDTLKEEWFTSNPSIDYYVTDVGDNIYYFDDEDFMGYGYQEMVEIDGETYMVSVNQPTKLSPSEKNELLQDLKDFNKLNSLTPLEI